MAYDILQSKPNGRLIRFDSKTGKHSILADKLYFPNGVEAHPDGESVLVCETTLRRIIRVYYAGNKKGSVEVFIRVPGSPDNIRLSYNKDGFWLALFTLEKPNSLVERLLGASGPTWLRELVALAFSSNSLMKMALEKVGIAVKVDLNGNVLHSLQDPEGKNIFGITEICEAPNGDLYFGGITNDFVGFVKKEFVKP